jgi:4-hydroxy-tetrahydrodipicolinate reductase
MPAVAVFGITGRMGQSLLQALREAPPFTLTGAIASAGSARLGQDAAGAGPPTGVLITADLGSGIRGADVAIDFSLNTGVAAHARACATARVPLLVGVTGLDAPGRDALQAAARDIAVLIAPNTSVGVNVVAKLVALAAAGLGPSYDAEVFEAHHRLKLDAPSGTALELGEAVAGARGRTLAEVATYDRTDHGAPRIPGSIGFSVQRGGDIVGEHTVTFAGEGEHIEITHRATDRITFARGALRAAEWLVGRPAGLYGMHNVLGFLPN